MSDTVTASAIVASLSASGPSFVPYRGAGESATDTAAGADASGFHVSGAAYASPVSGFGSPLLVDFLTLHPAPAPTVAPSTVPGYGPGWAFQDAAPGVAGAMHVTFDHLP